MTSLRQGADDSMHLADCKRLSHAVTLPVPVKRMLAAAALMPVRCLTGCRAAFGFEYPSVLLAKHLPRTPCGCCCMLS